MEKYEVKEKIYEIIEYQLGIDLEKNNDESRFIEDLGSDSLDVIELIMAAEDKFDINIPDKDVEENIKTVNDAIDYLVSHVA